MRLPYGQSVKLEQVTRKVATYSLNMEHAEGGHKAIVFRSKLGITIENKDVLIAALMDQAINGEAVFSRVTSFGDNYLIDFLLSTEVGRSIVRSAWLIDAKQQYPHLVSVYPIRK